MTPPVASLNASFDATRAALSRNMPTLEGLRGLAILTVMVHNVGIPGGVDPDGPVTKLLRLLVNSGWVGVQLFFVLSGFLITGILVDEKGRPHQFRNFYMRRTLRIFPLYYFTLALMLWLAPALGYAPAWLEQDRAHQIWYWTYTENWAWPLIQIGNGLGHFWSLAVEEQFYLVWPLLVILLPRAALVRACVLAILVAVAFRLATQWGWPALAERAAYSFTIARIDALALGALLAVLLRERESFGWITTWLPRAGLLTLVAVPLIMAVNHNFAPVTDGLGLFNQTLAALGFAALLLAALLPKGLPGRLLQRALNLGWLRTVGKYSYAMYVFHLPLMWWIEPQVGRYFPLAEHANLSVALVTNSTVMVSTLAVAWLSWRLLEQPFLKLKRFFPYH